MIFPPKCQFKRNTIPLVYIDSATRQSLAETSPYHLRCCLNPSSLLRHHVLQVKRPKRNCPRLLPLVSIKHTHCLFSLLPVRTHIATNARLRHLFACCCRDLCAADRCWCVCVLCSFAGFPEVMRKGYRDVGGQDSNVLSLAFDEEAAEGEA